MNPTAFAAATLVLFTMIFNSNYFTATAATDILSTSSPSSPESIANWFNQLPHTKERTTHLRFYFPDKVIDPNRPTFLEIAHSPLTASFPSGFGTVYVTDHPITAALDPDSTVLGRAQGILAIADRNELAYFMGFNFVFTAGEYNGSTITVLSRNPVQRMTREVAVVGGTGCFRLARGVAALESLQVADKNTTVVKFDVFVLHY